MSDAGLTKGGMTLTLNDIEERLIKPAMEQLAMPMAIEILQTRLTAARYAFHCVRKKNYKDAVTLGEMTEDQARFMYEAAMQNYDNIIENGQGGLAEIEDMERGFD